MTITLNKIRAHQPCSKGWAILLRYFSRDPTGKVQGEYEPISIATIVKSNGLDAALWVLKKEGLHGKQMRLFAVWCARRVEHLLVDALSLECINAGEDIANGKINEWQLQDVKRAAEIAMDGNLKLMVGMSDAEERRDAHCAARYCAQGRNPWDAAASASWWSNEALHEHSSMEAEREFLRVVAEAEAEAKELTCTQR